jgi:hypothetical protein
MASYRFVEEGVGHAKRKGREEKVGWGRLK